VTLAQSAAAAPSTPVVAAICAAEITQAGWLAGIPSAGYLLAVIPLVSLTDRRPSRQLYLASSALSALSCFGMALSDSLLPALGFRALAGIAMAGMYMPGLRALTHGIEGATRAHIAAWYTSSFTIGASLSFLFGRVGTLLGWRSAFVSPVFSAPPASSLPWWHCRAGIPEARTNPSRGSTFARCLQTGYPRPDRRLRRGHLGLRRIAAVDCRLPDLPCR
jgi:MFS family permease